MWVLSTGKEISLVYLCAQFFLFWKHFQYKPMDMSNMMITAIGVPMRDHKLAVNDLSFVNVLFILEMDSYFILAILLARAPSPLSVRIDIFRDCIKLKLFVLNVIY